MKTYLYISLMPEALVASNLNPKAFGAYLATGPKHVSRGSAIFFQLNEAFAAERLRDSGLDQELNEMDRIRRSAYLSIYRVLENTPLTAIESLHLATEDGHVLTLQPGEYPGMAAGRFHLYQQFCPVTPRVVSTLEPKDFAARITDRTERVSVPALVFAELKLEQLATDPEASNVEDLPYPNIEHLRDCLREIEAADHKSTKTVIRFLQQDVLFRTIRGGFYFAASGGGLVSFPMPPREELETTYYAWWRSALSTFGG